MRKGELDALNKKWKDVMEDPTVTRMTHGTQVNQGKSFLKDDLDAFRKRGLGIAEYFSQEIMDCPADVKGRLG